MDHLSYLNFYFYEKTEFLCGKKFYHTSLLKACLPSLKITIQHPLLLKVEFFYLTPILLLSDKSSFFFSKS